MVSARFFGSKFFVLGGFLALGLGSMGAGLQAQNPPEALPAAAATGSGAVSASYVLSPNDQLLIEVFQEDDLRTNTLISKDGTINFPLLGSVKLAGLSQAAARERIAELLKRDFLVSPQVSLSVVRFARKRFTVLGQVGRPGSYDIPDQESIDLLEAIAMAGGYTRIAQPAKVTIKRKVNGVEQVEVVDAKQMAKNPNATRYPIVPGDTITVAESIF
jgi:protein involved in polysaccharide export with SLBB domain